MTWFAILILAVIQGLTEFLPVSSSGHLVLAQEFLGVKGPVLTLDLILHAATLVAVFVFYRQDLEAIGRDTATALKTRHWRELLKESSGLRILYLVFWASVPTGLMGVLFHDSFESMFEGTRGLGESLMATGVALWFCVPEKFSAKRGIAETPVWMALVIGIVQGISIIPGISRSGSTIPAAIFLGLEAGWAARFSFLMSIPAIAGAVGLQLVKGELPPVGIWPLTGGFVVALVLGIVTLKWVVNSLARGTFRRFSYYVFPLGLFIWLYFNFLAL